MRLTPLDSEANPLWDIWYTGSTPFPYEVRFNSLHSIPFSTNPFDVQLINPAPRASIISAILHPIDYLAHADPSSAVNDKAGNEDHGARRVHLWELPDTSILFRRYLDAGRMINVYDWYAAFGQVLETQREKAREAAAQAHRQRQRTTKGKGKGKGQGKARGQEAEETGEEELDEEAWRIQVQARFIRALHELDYIGFLKHTGRKTDHVMKTVFELPE